MHFEALKLSDVFKCKRCGDCCKGFGGTFVTKEEIESISSHINTDPEAFIEKYCQISGEMPVLAQGKNDYCIFWDEQCMIHPVKPRMCKMWPFIKSVLVDINNWHVMVSLCPGIHTDVPGGTIQKFISKELSKNF